MSLSSFLGHQFSHYGRAGRLEFFAYFWITLLFVVLLAAPFVWVSWEYINASIDYGPDVALMMSEDDEFTFFTTTALYFWLYGCWMAVLCLNVANVMTACRRLNDIGWSKWCVLLIFFPIVNILFFIFLCIWPGKKISDEESLVSDR